MIKSIIKFGMLLGLLASQAVVAEAQTYGPVAPNESLYRIALKFRVPDVTVSQLMIAIFENNPQAFDDRNINRLKVGSLLQVPDIEAIAQLNRQRAYEQASSQIDDFQQQQRQARVESGELEPLSSVPREPDLAPLVQLSLLDLNQLRLEPEADAPAVELAQTTLPEPKVDESTTRQRRAPPPRPLFNYSYDVAVVNDDNVRLAQDDEDIREDLIVSGTVKARGGKSLDSFSIWNYGFSAGYNLFETFDDLNHSEIEANTRYRFALSSGFTAPIFTLGARISGLEFDSEMRDSTLLSLSAELTQWITNTINMTAGLGFKDRESKSEAFDTTESRIFVNFDTNLTKVDLVYTTFTYIAGDVVSSATPTLAIINAADAIEPDDAFGGVDANQFAYRIDSDTVVFTVGYNRIFTRDLSLDVSARFVDAESVDDDSIGYDRTILRASLLGRF